jgi:hypothetical protein
MYRSLLIAGVRPDRLLIVKALLLAFALALCSTSAFAEDWTTTDGTNYPNVRVIRVEDDAITILYKDGGALIPLFKLTPALQKRFDYDPVKAKAAAEARTKADAENAKQLQAEIEQAEKLKREQQIKDAQARGQTNAPPKP